MSAVIRGLRTAAIDRLKAEVSAVAGRVFTGQVPQDAPLPYLTIGDYAEAASDHYGVPGSASGFQIRAVVRAPTGDAPVLEIWEQIHAALQYRPLSVSGHDVVTGEVRLVTSFAEPTDANVRHLVARYEAISAVTL